jgi:segregation and condensation protein A
MDASNPRVQIDHSSGPYGVKVELFEGPLDLLLFLIRKDEIDIYDIPIADITRHFLEYVEIIEGLNLELAGDFVVMAATLMRIKSRMLLPSDPGDDEEEGDPREELVRRLLEYQQYKDVAEWLEDQQETFRDVYYRGSSVDVNDLSEEEDEEGFRPVSMFELLSAFKRAIDSAPKFDVHEVTRSEVTTEERIHFVLSTLAQRGQVPFFDLIAGAQRAVIVVTFVAILELMKELKVTVKQVNLDGEIWVYQRGPAEQSPQSEEGSKGKAVEDV